MAPCRLIRICVISVGTGSAECVMSVGRRSDFFTYINVRVEVPYGGYNKLMCNSTRLIMIWRHVVARKSAALHEQFEQFELEGFIPGGVAHIL